jgi:hypothetical protein
MKRFTLSALALFCLATGSMAQNNVTVRNTDYVRKPALGISFIFNDYKTAQLIQNSSLSSVLNNKQFSKIKQMSPGIALSYFKGLSNNVDFAGTLAGSFVENAVPDKVSTSSSFLLEGDASVNLKMLSDKYIFSPYLSAGVGASTYKGYYGAFIPVGGGIKFNLFDEAAIFVNAKYHAPVTTGTSARHFVFGLGIAGTLGSK